MHCDPRKATVQANTIFQLKYNSKLPTSLSDTSKRVGPPIYDTRTSSLGLQSSSASTESVRSIETPSSLFERRETLRALLQRASAIAKDPGGDGSARLQVAALLETELCPSLSGISSAYSVGVARAALRKPLGEVAQHQPSSFDTSSSSSSGRSDSAFGSSRPSAIAYGIKRSSARAIVNTLCSRLPLSVEAQLTLELALCSVVGSSISGGRGEAVPLKASNEHLQLKVVSVLESAEAEATLSSLPSDLLEAVCSAVDVSLRRKLTQVLSRKQHDEVPPKNLQFPLRALLSGNTESGRHLLDVHPLPFEQLSQKEASHQQNTEDLVNHLLAEMGTRGATIMESSSADKYIAEVGRSLTSTAEKCENEIREFSRVVGMKGAPLIANLISAMCKSHFPAGGDDPVWMSPTNVLSGGWPGQKDGQGGGQSGGVVGGPQEALDWNVDVLFRAISAVESGLEWKDVVREFDNPNFLVKDRAGLRFLWQVLLKAFDGNAQRVPMDIIYGKWQHCEGQFFLLKQMLTCPDIVKLTECLPCTKPEPVVAQEKPSGGGSAGQGHDEDSNPLFVNWKVMEVHETLMTLCDRPDLHAAIQDLYKQAKESSHDTITTALLQVKLPMSAGRRALLKDLVQYYLGGGAHNAQAILHFAWSGCPHLQPDIHKIVKESMVEYYTSGDGESSRLTRILELAQEIKCLQSLLATARTLDAVGQVGVQNTITFAIDLACLASRREYLKLDKWMADNLSANIETFMPACVSFLQRKVPYLVGKPGENGAHLITPDCVHTMLATMLSQGPLIKDEQLKIRLSEVFEQVQNMMESFNMMATNKRRPVAGQTSQHAVPPAHLAAGQVPPGGFHLPHSQHHPVNLGQPPHMAPPPGQPQGEMLGFRNPTTAMQPHYQAGPKPGQVFGPGGPQAHAGSMALISNPMALSVPTTPATDEFLQSGDLSKVHVSKETEDEANSYFQKIYNQPQIKQETIKEFLEMLRRFSNSSKPNEREVFQCMIRNLFEEYRFFPSYPDKELTITAQLFGGIIDYELVRYQTLTMAHKFVMDAIKKPQNMKMFYFGIVALDCFKAKIRSNPAFCQHLHTCPTFSMFPEHLQVWVEYGTKGQEPPGKPKGAMPQLSNGKLGPSNPQQAVKKNTVLSATGKPSIATATNIDTLLGASDKVDKIVEPNEHTADKIGFIINNLSQANVQQKSEEFRELVGDELYPWFARYMVVKRASIESNFHSLYVNFLDTINSPTLSALTLTETYRNIRVLLRSDKEVSDFTDRALLKSLGHWLGLLTIARNRPILTLDIDLKALLIEAYHKGLQDLLYVVPFIAKILESAVKSKIFRPPSPFTMGLVYALVELHSEQGLKLNLKFEVEVLCKALCLDVQQVKNEAIQRHCFNVLRNHTKLALLDSPLLGPPIQQNTPNVSVPAPPMPTPQQVASGPPHSHVSAQGPASKVNEIIPMIQQFNIQNTAGGGNGAMVPGAGMLHGQSGPPEEFLQQQQQQQQQQMGVGVPGVPPQNAQPNQPGIMAQAQQGPGNLTPTQMMQQQQPPTPQYSLREFNAVTPNMLPALVSIPPNIPLFQANPNLKMHVRSSVEQSIQEWMKPVVERVLKITLVTCENIVKKDFALEPDENKMRLSLHNMVRAVTAAMVIVTCKEPLFITITNNAKKLLRDALNQLPYSSKEQHVDQAAAAIANENVELATCFIQKTAIEKAVNEADKKFATLYEARKVARKEGKVWCDHNALSYQERMPESLRLKLGGIPASQMAVYEEFARNVPGFASSPGPGERVGTGQFAGGVNQHDTRSAEAYFPGQFTNQSGQPTQKMQQAQPQQMMMPPRVPQMDDTTGPVGLVEKMFLELEILVNYITTHISNTIPQAMPAASQLAMNVHVVQEALQLYRQANFEISTGYMVVQKTLESLLEGLFILNHPSLSHLEGGHGHPHPSDWANKYRETHILVLKVLSDRSLLGYTVKLPNIVAKVLLEHPNEEARYNLPVFDALLRSNMLFVPMFDVQLAALLDQSVSFAALAFAKDLVRVVNSYRESGVLPDVDMPHTLEAIYHHRRMPPPIPPHTNPQQQPPQQPPQQQQAPMAQHQQQQRQQQQQQQPLNPNSLADEFGGAAPELMLGPRAFTGGPGGQGNQLEYNSPPMAMMHSGMSEARNPENDPPDLQTKTECLLQDWVTMYSSSHGKDSTKNFQLFVQQMNMQGILKTDDLITKFFRLSTEMCVEHTYRQTTKAAQQVSQQTGPQPAGGDGLSGSGGSISATHNSPALAAHQCVNVARNKCFLTLDAYVRLIAMLVKHSGDQSNPITKVNLLNKVLGIIAGVLVHDHENRAGDFRQLAYHRMFLMLFLELTAPEPILEVFSFQTLMAFCNTLHMLHPSKVPGFAFAWLELISHRMFLARMLAITPQQKAWGMFAQLLQDLFKFLSPFLRNMELTPPVHLLYKGTIRVLLVLLHDFPEFLVDYHHGLCDLIPANCVQMRNLILSAFPRHMRLPDPFTPLLRVETIPECAQLPRILPNYTTMIQSLSLRKDLDAFLKTRLPAGIVNELIEALLVQNNAQGSAGPAEAGSRYNIPLVNALVLYVGSQAIASMQPQTQQQPYHFADAGGRTPAGQKPLGPQAGQGNAIPLTWQCVARTPHAELFEQLMAKMDNEGRYLVLNAIANQLRFPNAHTAYFSALTLALFAGLQNIQPVNADEDSDGVPRHTMMPGMANVVREQITRVLLERLIVNRPHPWGLLVTFVELLKNTQLNFWSYEFIRCAPEIEKLFDSVARSCVGPKPVGTD